MRVNDHLSQTNIIRGMVRKTDGSPVSGAFVTVEVVSTNPGYPPVPEIAAKTTLNGTFSFSLPPGTYKLTAFISGQFLQSETISVPNQQNIELVVEMPHS